MMPGICFLVYAHVRHVRQNFGTRTWSRMAIFGNCRTLDSY